MQIERSKVSGRGKRERGREREKRELMALGMREQSETKTNWESLRKILERWRERMREKGTGSRETKWTTWYLRSIENFKEHKSVTKFFRILDQFFQFLFSISLWPTLWFNFHSTLILINLSVICVNFWKNLLHDFQNSWIKKKQKNRSVIIVVCFMQLTILWFYCEEKKNLVRLFHLSVSWSNILENFVTDLCSLKFSMIMVRSIEESIEFMVFKKTE